MLVQFGLTRNESLVYVSLVKLIEATAYTVSKETKIPKTTVYEILESLKDKGFVSKSRVNNASYYTAESANRFLTNANEKVNIAKLIIPELENVKHLNKDEPSVKFYTGEEGVKRAFDDVLVTLKESGEKMMYAVADRDMKDFVPTFFSKWLEKREKLGVFTKLLTHEDEKRLLREPEIFNNNELRETRLIPREYIFSTSMDIYANKVTIFSHKDQTPHAVIIESEYIAETLKKFFEFMWKFAEITK